MGGVQKRRTLIVSKLESFYGTSVYNGLGQIIGKTSTYIFPIIIHSVIVFPFQDAQVLNG